MNIRVKNFIEKITKGTDVKTAIKETNINKMNIRDILVEIAKEFK